MIVIVFTKVFTKVDGNDCNVDRDKKIGTPFELPEASDVSHPPARPHTR